MVAAAAATAATTSKRANLKKVSTKHLHLQLERQQLQHELTTRFPNKELIQFDQDLELLMMNGYYQFIFQCLPSP